MVLHRLRPNIKASVIVFIVYFGAARFGLLFDPVSHFATLVWPATGIALASVMLFGFSLWPGIALGAFLANFFNGASLLVASGIATGNTLEALVGVLLLNYFSVRPYMRRVGDIIYFILYGAITATMLSATVGVTSLLAGGAMPFSAYESTWKAWWIGDVVGALVFGPFLLVWLSQRRLIIKELTAPSRVGEKTALLLGTIGIGVLVFGNIVHTNTNLTYIVFLPLMWAALRFGPRGAASMGLCMSVLAIAGTRYSKKRLAECDKTRIRAKA